MELRPNPGLLHGLLEAWHFERRQVLCLFQVGFLFGNLLSDDLEGFFCGDDARLHRSVGALDLGDVEKAGAAADQGTARECELGDGLQAALVESSGAVGDTLAALKQVREEGVVFHALELPER